MRLVCPSCGAIHSAESWLSNADARLCLNLLTEFPWETARLVFNYLALFRPGGDRGLIWSKTLRLMKELHVLVLAPTVKWDRGAARPNSARVWALAMERIIEMPPKKLPLKSHGYLNAIAYEIADEMDAKEERKPRAPALRIPGSDKKPERISFSDMQGIRKKNMGDLKWP